MRYNDELAVVLHVRAWRETSLLIELLTQEHGRIGCVARSVNGAKKHAFRAALQPFQLIRFNAAQKTELAHLSAAESVDNLPVLAEDVALSVFYINELILRLVPKHDPHQHLFELYLELRTMLKTVDLDRSHLAWILRQFERDFLDLLGLGIDLSHDVHGVSIDAGSRYWIDPEAGARQVIVERNEIGSQVRVIKGSVLLALRANALPDKEHLRMMRLIMRDLLNYHLNYKPLKSWELMQDLQRLAATR